jgi:folate-binding protein YgfZ
VIEISGPDRVAFLQGQITQDARGLAPGEVRPMAGLSPKGKLIYAGRMRHASEAIELLLPAILRPSVLAHLAKYAVFQKVAVTDRSGERLALALYGPGAAGGAASLGGDVLPGEGEIAFEVLLPAASREPLEEALARAGSVALSPESAEALRLEAGRPRWGQDFDGENFVDEVGLSSAVSATKGCYVGQEIVARTRTYGRVNRRLVSFAFPEGLLEAGTPLVRPGEAPGKIEIGRVTSASLSPRRGAIGLGYAFREIAAGDVLESAEDPRRPALVSERPSP